MATDSCSLDSRNFSVGLAKILDLATEVTVTGGSGEAEEIRTAKGKCVLCWGKREKDESVCLAIVDVGTEFSEAHNHVEQDEVIFNIRGSFEVEMKDKTIFVGEGGSISIPKGVSHHTSNYHTESGEPVIQAAIFTKGLTGSGLNGHDRLRRS